MSDKIEFVFRPATKEEEKGIIWYLLNGITWYRENGYKGGLPIHSKIEELERKSLNKGKLDDEDWNIVSFVVDEIYDLEGYLLGVRILNSSQNKLKKIKFKLLEYNQLWGFKIFKKYDIILCKYGGSSYDYENGKIYLSFDKSKSNKEDRFQTVVHEVIHIGIEQFIIKYKITHNEKERIIDLFCSIVFKLNGYEIQNRGDNRIDEFIISNDFNVPKALEEYVRKYPR